jgi:uncharacterized glyoxalase superfamily protein PhnB
MPVLQGEFVMMMSPYLTYHGDCRAAFEFYEKCGVGTARSLRTCEWVKAFSQLCSQLFSAS